MVKLKGVAKGLNKIDRNLEKRKKGIDKVSLKALDRFGAIIRQDARKRIGPPSRPRKSRKVFLQDEQREVLIASPPSKPRPPGKSPRARRQDGFSSIRKIIYETSKSEQNVKIGFGSANVKYGAIQGAELHEFGGRFNTKVFLAPAQPTLQDLKVTGKGAERQYTRKKSSLTIIESRRYGKPVSFRMPKRPTIRPAFNKHKLRMTKIFIDYYRARFGT